MQTQAYAYHLRDPASEANSIFIARVLAFAPSTWYAHSSHTRKFRAFCEARSLNPFDSTHYIINLYLLHLSQNGVTYDSVKATMAALSFMFRFYFARDFTDDDTVRQVSRFVQKVSPKTCNKKSAYGSAEIRKLWDSIDDKGGIETLSLLDLRTFVLSVFQHTTFCRFSDISRIKLTDVLHTLDYFKISIDFSKTDQQGHGHFVYVPKLESAVRDPHMLMCLYINRIGTGHEDNTTLEYLFPPLY